MEPSWKTDRDGFIVVRVFMVRVSAIRVSGL